jgi:isopropylmalate/homocitrate/citramalate synthase
MRRSQRTGDDSHSMCAGLVMGKHSGSAALRQRLNDLGFADLPKEQVADIFKRFKKVLQSEQLFVWLFPRHQPCLQLK